jgi:6-hydroxycyclohex-1-ene-1-carbonyl-CoA dehydrogenase
MVEPSAPLKLTEITVSDPGPGEARLKVDGCGLCHTDLGFLYGGVRTRKPLPLTLGHEIAGTVEAVGPGPHPGEASLSPGQRVIVPAVLPCGECEFCRSGRDNICLAQKMPGNDLDGGFATHITVPTRFLIPMGSLPPGHEPAHLAVVADAVTTPYQALVRAKVGEGDTVVVVGTGGIGIYGVQIASVLGARVIAVDIDASRVEAACAHGASVGVVVTGSDERVSRKQVTEEAKKAGLPRHGWKVFEMSGSVPGQSLAFSLLSYAGTLGIVGFTRDKVEVRLSNLMAFDADAFGSWGCSPRHYRTVVDLIAQERIHVKPFVTFEPMERINEVLEKAHHGGYKTRPVLVPGS